MKILVIQQKMIGDVLTSSILFEGLRQKYPAAELHYLIYRHTLPVIQGNPYIDQLLLYDEKEAYSLVRMIERVRTEHYSMVIDVYSKIGSGILSFLSGAPLRISYKKWYTSWMYTKTYTYRTKAESGAGLAIENRMLLLSGLKGIPPGQLRPRIFLSEQEKEKARDQLLEAGVDLTRPLLMCAVLGSSSNKTYPPRYMARILDHVSETYRPQLLYNYMPSQEETAMRIFSDCSPLTKSCSYFRLYTSSLREFLAVTSHCDALIGNEGGAVNMAKALGLPTFAIFSPQIRKENWSIFEDGKKHVGVHLRDYNKGFDEGLGKRQIAKKAVHFYELLEPRLIFAKLDQFLNFNLPPRKNP